jgi:hypothetical protein
MSDKRKARRVPLKGLAQVYLPDGHNYPTYVANISKGGIGIFMKEQIESGTELAIKLFYEDRAGVIRSDEVKGEVKWANEGFFAHGILLQPLDKKKHKDLFAYIESQEHIDPVKK